MIAIRGGRGRPQIGGKIKTRDPHAVILVFYLGSARPAQRGGNCDKSLTETAAVERHCVILQLSVCIK